MFKVRPKTVPWGTPDVTWFFFWLYTINNDCLCAGCEKIFYPFQGAVSNAVIVKLGEESFVGYFVKIFGKVHNYISLDVVVFASSWISFTWSWCSKSMLQKVVFSKWSIILLAIFHDFTQVSEIGLYACSSLHCVYHLFEQGWSTIPPQLLVFFLSQDKNY